MSHNIIILIRERGVTLKTPKIYLSELWQGPTMAQSHLGRGPSPIKRLLKRHHNWLSNANFGQQIVGMQTVASISHVSIAMQTVVHSYANRRRKLMWQRSTSEDNSSLLDSKVDLRHLDDADLWEQYNQQNPPWYILHTVLLC